jgi:anti-anti-sigma regulatory factor
MPMPAPTPDVPARPPDEGWSAWTADDFDGLADVMAAWRRHGTGPGGDAGAAEATALIQAIEQRDLGPFFDTVDRQAQEVAAKGTPFEEILRELARSSAAVAEAVAAEYAALPDRLVRAMRAFVKLKDGLAVRAGEAFAKQRVSVAEEAQRKVIRELSTPVVEVWEGILVMPLIGVVDSRRARQMMEQLLDRIRALGSRVVILDVTGVPTVDTEVANHFLRTMQAARLVGASTILVGISPAMAQALVHLDITLPGLETFADLRSGLEAALERLGFTVVARRSPAGASPRAQDAETP